MTLSKIITYLCHNNVLHQKATIEQTSCSNHLDLLQEFLEEEKKCFILILFCGFKNYII